MVNHEEWKTEMFGLFRNNNVRVQHATIYDVLMSCVILREGVDRAKLLND